MNLDKTNATKASLEHHAKIAENHMELEAELHDILVQGGEMFIKGQDLIRKELIKHFPIEEFFLN